MIRWEYISKDFAISSLQEELNSLGSEGWELINISETQMRGAWHAVLKRQLASTFLAGGVNG